MPKMRPRRDVRRVTLSSGVWVDLEPLTGNDYLAIKRAPDDEADTLLEIIGKRAVSTSVPSGNVLDLSLRELGGLFKDWMRQTEDDALPPDNGQRSASDS